jgi:hypothetical protein
MDRAELIRRLNLRKAELTQELGQQIHHIEEVEASIQAIEGREITPIQFPPQNPFRGVPVRRIDTDTYLLIARRIIGNQVAGQTRVPGAEKPALLQELEQRRREIRRIIASLDREIEEREARGQVQIPHDNSRQIIKDRDYLRAELQFYIDLTEALNYQPTRTTPDERAEANQRARTWVENIGRNRANRR